MVPVYYSYLRFSTPRQEWGDSERRQSEASAALARENGWMAAAEGFYADRGVSALRGKHAQKGALSLFLDRVRTGDIKPGSVLIIENVDRLGRDEMADAMGRVLDIVRAGVVLATTMPRRLYTSASLGDPGAFLELWSSIYRANDESERKADRIRAKWEARRRRARDGTGYMFGPVPGWLRWDGGAYRLIPDRVATVREIVRLARQGEGTRRIAAALANDPERYPPWGRSGQWTQQTVADILKNPALWGALQPRHCVQGHRDQPIGDPIEGYYPAAIDKKEVLAVLAAMKGRRRAGGRRGPEDSNLFTGILVNAATGQRMNLARSKHRGQWYSYLVDGRNTSRAKGEPGTRVPYEVMEKAILDHVAGLTVAELLGAAQVGAGQGQARMDLEEKLASIDGKLAALADEIADPGTGAGAMARLTDAMRRVEQQRTAVADALSALRAHDDSPPSLTLAECQRSIADLAGAAGPDRAAVRARIRSGLRRLLEGIWVYVQQWHKTAKAVHVQTWYRTGAHTTLPVLLGNIPRRDEVLDLRGHDLRLGYPSARRQQRGSA